MRISDWSSDVCSSDLGDQLVRRGIDIVGELDLDDRALAISAHAHGDGDDSALRDGSVKDTLNTMLPLQALGCAKHATEKPHVLAKYDHLGNLLERTMHRVIDRLDHRHLSPGRPEERSVGKDGVRTFR